MAYVKTGYKRGRPRKGEMRPLTPARRKRLDWYEKNHKDPEFRKKRAAEHREWYNNNVAKARKISRDSYKRKVAWKKARIITMQLGKQ
jgi:hypothetical protein